MRKTTKIYLSATIMLLGVFYAFPSEIIKGNSKSNKHSNTKQVKKEIIYKPPFRGAPINRVFGGTRGNIGNSLALEVLTPEQTGLTYQSQPMLYWFISETFSGAIEFTLNQENVEIPILDRRLPGPVAVGINQIDLSNYDVRLLLDVEYEWSIALILDEKNRSKDVVSIGHIRKVTPSFDIGSILKIAVEYDHPAIFAERGIWYDAFETLSRFIYSNPEDVEMTRKRADLLASVGLTEAAKFEHNRTENLKAQAPDN